MAVNTDISIVNRALQAIGTRSNITSLTEDSNEAIEANKLFVPVRNQVLRAARWPFARDYDTLTLHKTATGSPWTRDQPEQPWLYSYEYPAECIHPRMVSGGVRFISGTDHDDGIRVILTNVPDASITFTRLVTDYDLWDDMAIQAFVSALAGFLVMPLNGSLQQAQGQINQANQHLRAAQAEAANEQMFGVDVTPDWIAARSDEPAIARDFFVNPNGPLFSL